MATEKQRLVARFRGIGKFNLLWTYAKWKVTQTPNFDNWGCSGVSQQTLQAIDDCVREMDKADLRYLRQQADAVKQRERQKRQMPGLFS